MLTLALLVLASGPSMVCDWTDKEARTFIHWENFRLHAAHEDRAAALCESHRLWSTTIFAKSGGDDEGFRVTPLGAGVYSGRLCRAVEEADRSALVCNESATRRTSACIERAGVVSFPGGTATLKCLSDDPSVCR